MKNLSLELLENMLKTAPDAKVVEKCPEGLDEDLFEKFLRVLKATSPLEIADVTDDELFRMLEEGGKYFGVLVFDNFFDESMFSKLSRRRSVNAARRVL